MNREDIIRIAREAGMPPVEITSDKPVLYPALDAIERFAAFVAAAEREACAKVCDDDQSQAGEWTADAHVGSYFAARIRARRQA